MVPAAAIEFTSSRMPSNGDVVRESSRKQINILRLRPCRRLPPLVFIDVHWFSRISIVFIDFLCFSLICIGLSLMFIEFHCFSFFITSHHSALLFITFHRFHCLSSLFIALHYFSLLCIAFHSFSLLSIAFYRFSWLFMAFHCFS